MNIRNKILLLFFSSITILSVVLYFFRQKQEEQHSLIVKSAAEQQVLLINTAINVQSDQLDQLVTDYTNWDEIINNLKKPNAIWAEDNIASIVKSFNLYRVCAYNANSQLIYKFGVKLADPSDKQSSRKEIIDIILKNGIIHYFQIIPGGLLEISASSIHPTNDTARITPPAGYFFISRIWNEKFLQKLSINTASKVYFTDKRSNGSKLIENDSITVSRELLSFDGQPIGFLVIKKPNNVLINYHKVSNFVFNFLGLLLIFLVFTFFIILYQWIRRPLKIISQSLKDGDTSKLDILKKNKNEFSQIASLISIFHHQKQELEREYAEINTMQQKLVQQKKLLQGMALASNHLLTNEDFHFAIHDALKTIGKAAGIDRIFIYKNESDRVTQEKKVVRIHEYISPQIEPLIDTREGEKIIFTHHSDGWYTPLLMGKTIKGLAGEFREDLRLLFESQRINSLMIVPIMDLKNHHFWGFVGFADCTSEHIWTTAEETILSMLSDNIGGVIKRQISQEELKAAMEMSKMADRAKSEFLASMSHEIRTPMNGVIGMTSLLLLSDLTPSQREYVNIIENSGESLMNIINEILDFSKIESGHMELEESSYDLRLCIEDVLDLMAPKALEKHLDIIYFIDPKVNQYIFGDGFRLRQIIVNLVSNAIKFTEKGDILIYISLASQKDKNVVLEFSVKDTGIGIPESKIDTLFSPFTQVDASTTRKYGGTGLGLAITASLVKLMKGKIWVNSQDGNGSDFHFTLQTTYSIPDEGADKVNESLQSLPGKSILIVDDNATNRRILCLQCEYWGMKPTACETGKEALVLLDNNRFDAGIIDMQMPEMDGIMLAREIRKKHSKDHLPLIMLTSIGFNREADELKKLFSHYVNKPIKHSQLGEILLKVIAPKKELKKITLPDYENLSEISKKYPFQVLIAEDNLINQKLIRNVFDLLGYKADIAANGLEALSALKLKNYNLIFMDIQMPEMNGYEATGIIVERRKDDRPIIIAMTANAMQGDREKCIEAGMDDYITKPMRIDELIRVIKFWGEKQYSLKKMD
jgi:signal transduction histidine kinase/CheY-like chemotaxis protein